MVFARQNTNSIRFIYIIGMSSIPPQLNPGLQDPSRQPKSGLNPGGYKTFSVLIISHEQKERLEKTLDSFSRQIYPSSKFEVIVINRGSQEGTDELLQEYVHVAGFSLKCKKTSTMNPDTARNEALELASGEIILFSNDDFIADPDLLVEHNKCHRENAGSGFRGIVGSTALHPDIETTPFLEFLDSSNFKYPNSSFPDGMEVPFYQYTLSNLSLPRSAVHKAGGFDEEYSFGEDYNPEFGYRLSRLGVRVFFHEDAKAYFTRTIQLSEFVERSFQTGRAYVNLYLKHPELKDLGIGIDALINPAIRRDYFESVIRYAILIGMEQGLRGKVSENSPNITQLLVILEEKRQEHQNYLENRFLEQSLKISGLQAQLQTLKNENILLKSEIGAVKQTFMWRMTTALHQKCVGKLLPPHTRRRDYFELVMRGGRLLASEGVIATLSRFKLYLKQHIACYFILK